MKSSTAFDANGGALRFRVLEPSDVEHIHELSLSVLRQTGIQLHYPAARQLLQHHGRNSKCQTRASAVE
jgi:trimethylamine:corrinoid methyltransferase-like protein